MSAVKKLAAVFALAAAASGGAGYNWLTSDASVTGAAAQPAKPAVTDTAHTAAYKPTPLAQFFDSRIQLKVGAKTHGKLDDGTFKALQSLAADLGMEQQMSVLRAAISNVGINADRAYPKTWDGRIGSLPEDQQKILGEKLLSAMEVAAAPITGHARFNAAVAKYPDAKALFEGIQTARVPTPSPAPRETQVNPDAQKNLGVFAPGNMAAFKKMGDYLVSQPGNMAVRAVFAPTYNQVSYTSSFRAGQFSLEQQDTFAGICQAASAVKVMEKSPSWKQGLQTLGGNIGQSLKNIVNDGVAAAKANPGRSQECDNLAAAPSAPAKRTEAPAKRVEAPAAKTVPAAVAVAPTAGTKFKSHTQIRRDAPSVQPVAERGATAPVDDMVDDPPAFNGPAPVNYGIFNANHLRAFQALGETMAQASGDPVLRELVNATVRHSKNTIRDASQIQNTDYPVMNFRQFDVLEGACMAAQTMRMMQDNPFYQQSLQQLARKGHRNVGTSVQEIIAYGDLAAGQNNGRSKLCVQSSRL